MKTEKIKKEIENEVEECSSYNTKSFIMNSAIQKTAKDIKEKLLKKTWWIDTKDPCDAYGIKEKDFNKIFKEFE